MKILMYADVDMNLVDGSSIWVSSFIEMMTIYGKKLSITLLLKKPIKRGIVLEGILSNANVHLIDIWKLPDFLEGELKLAIDRKELLPNEAFYAIQKIQALKQYDTIFIRGINVFCELANHQELAEKCIVYVIGKQDIERTLLVRFSKIGKYIACQTPELLNYYVHNGIPEEKLFVLPPMIPDTHSVDTEFKRKGYQLVYAGKFSPGYHSLEILNCFEEIEQKIPKATLSLLGDKFYNYPKVNNFKERFLKKIKKNKRIIWHKALPRQIVLDLISKADLGISWRSNEFNDSLELSTKLLEFASLGKPIILNRTEMHEKLLGGDYPLFANSKRQFIDSVVQCFSSEEIYENAAKRVFVASQKYLYKNVFGSVSDRFLPNNNHSSEMREDE